MSVAWLPFLLIAPAVFAALLMGLVRIRHKRVLDRREALLRVLCALPRRAVAA